MAAAEQMDVPVVIDPGEIARAKPAIFEDRLARTPWLQIRVEHARPTQVQLAVVAHFGAVVRQRASDRTGPFPRRIEIEQRQAGIGIFNGLFYGPELYRRTGRDVNSFSGP